MFRVFIHPSSGACDLFVELFHGLYCSGRYVLVLRCGLARVVWYPSQAPEDGCINIRNMLSSK